MLRPKRILFFAVLSAIVMAFSFNPALAGDKFVPVKGGDGLTLAVREWGNPNGPAILFIHGWSQSHMSWEKQYTDKKLAKKYRMVALDLRGHGDSEKPLGPENYTNSQLWADDIAAVIKEMKLNKPVLVGWSYGGAVICDYLRFYGDSAVSGVNFVGAANKIMQSEGFPMIGPVFLGNAGGMCGPNMVDNILATINFVAGCSGEKPIAKGLFNKAVAYNMIVPVQVRGALAARNLNNDDVLSKISVPCLVTHGTADKVVLPAMGKYTAKMAPNAKLSWYKGAGHVPFLSDADRFNSELDSLVTKCRK